MTEALTGLAAMLVLSFLRVPIAFSMGLVGFAGLWWMRGLGPSMAVLPMVTIVTGVVIAAAIAVLLLGGGGLLMMVGAALGTGLVTFIAWHFLGGFTGDVLGAAAVTARMAGLGAFALAVTP